MDEDVDQGSQERLCVAFFRALNLGHPHCPTRSQLEGAFLAAGAAVARSVQTAGTVVFAPAGQEPARQDAAGLVDEVCERLVTVCGFRHRGFVRTATWASQVVDAAAALAVPDGFRACVTLHDAAAPPPVELPWTSSTGDLVLVTGTADHTLSVVRPGGGKGADPNSTLEQLLGVPATTRVTTTLARVRKVLGEVAC